MNWTIALVALALMAGNTARAQQIVIYDSRNEGSRPAVDAATGIGAEVHAYEAGEELAWIADVNDGADLVVLDANSNHLVRSDQLDAMAGFLNANPNGKAVCALWFMSQEPNHALWQIMDLQYCADVVDAFPIYQWTSHPIWSGVPNPIRNLETDWIVDGARVEPIGGGTAIGGFANGSSSCQAGLVINSESRTVYIGETGRGGTYDDDGDGVRDWVEMYGNIYNFLLGSPTPVAGTTWGKVKSLYR